MIVMIDNYDSFTYNIVQELREIGTDLEVFRNDKISIDEIAALTPDGLVVSPGPGRPEDAGISMAAIEHFAGKVPILGVCLGHQSIGQVYGAKIVRAERIMHGKTSEVTCNGEGVFRGFGAQPFTVMRYHSLCIDPESLPAELEVTATADDGCIMGVRHKTLPVFGVQYHPESIMTPTGRKLLRNFTKICSEFKKEAK